MHNPVLLKEVINHLNIKEDKIYVDCTLGLGGHSFEILKLLNEKGMLIGIERDEASLNIAQENLKQFNNCHLFHANYTELKSILHKINVAKITGGVLLDLGISSLHFDNPERGFSIKSDSLLDMRMDRKQDITAHTIVNKYKEEELSEIIFKYGEERFSRRIARKILESRNKNGSIKTTGELANLVLQCYPKRTYYKIHPATRTFQAIRIEVNKELENLDKFLCFIPELLLPQSRLTVISFHSLEDRIVKNSFRNNKEFKVITKKPLIPSDDEIGKNHRSRSAKLRVAEKT